jgi:hypothetical protein
MTTARRFAYGFCGFTLSLVTAITVMAGLRLLLAAVWMTPPGFVIEYGSLLAIVSMAIATTSVRFLQSLKNRAMVRGIWFRVCIVIGIALVGLALSLVTGGATCTFPS